MTTESKKAELARMLAGVDEMAEAMKAKLRAKARAGYEGGLDPTNRWNVARKLEEHVETLVGRCAHCKHGFGEHPRERARQAVDVCNLALMLWLVDSRP